MKNTLWRLRLYDDEVGSTCGDRQTVPRCEIWRWRFEIADAIFRAPNPAEEIEWERLKGRCKSRNDAMRLALENGGRKDGDGEW
jgi:hypothetical protein